MQTSIDLVRLHRLVKRDENGDKTQPHLRVVLPNSHAGGIIGFKGYHARRIQTNFLVFLQVYAVEGANWGRLICTRGQPKNLSKAWYECARLLLESYPDYYHQRVRSWKKRKAQRIFLLTRLEIGI
jgi:hypothetical protein